ncbi:serine hydrolase domain-containing protein [Clostridium sp.]|uniref:serine hydrolase domain-containing protein n=1 Tax=Clostridium sp. TaxID=1506 RepID=UPI002FDEC263
MKKAITYIQRFLIIFVIIAYSLPYFCCPISIVYHMLSTKNTTISENKKVKSNTSLLSNQNKETLTEDNVEKFADSIFNEQLKKFNVPGAVFTVVNKNKILFQKGYGYSDIDKKVPVNPQKTIFRVASISKLFTATAVMQLKERGKVNLNEDINNYFRDFKIKNNYSKPVTLEDLLTHTGGFDERLVGEQTESYLQEKSLKDSLISHLRPVIREPGEAPQYSNYGMAAAGYIVESVSGIPFYKYMEDNIFTLLHMNSSSFIFNNKVLSNLSQGYDYKNCKYVKVPIYGQALTPAGGLKTTADDMAKFMIAHLNDGTYGNTHILNKNTAEDMHSQHFAFNKNMVGICYGFEQNYVNGIRTIYHRGDDYGFHSMLCLIPDSNLGFFISTNGEAGTNLCINIANQFISRYCTQSKIKTSFINKDKSTKSDLKKFEGIYRGVRYPKKEIGKLLLLMSSTINVKSNNNTLIMNYPGGQDSYTEIEPSLFKNIKRGDMIAFKSDKRGNINYMLQDGSAVALEKIHWYENPNLHKAIFILFALSFLCILFMMILLSFKNKARQEPLIHKYHRWIILLICILNLVFLLGMARECIALSSSFMFSPKLPKAAICLLFIPIFTTILTFGQMFSIFIYHNRKSFNFIAICYIVIYCIFLMFNLFLNYWNLFGFKFY